MKKEIRQSDNEVIQSKKELDAERKKMNEVAYEIDEIKKHPIKRQGGDLLSSLRKKLN